MDPDQLTQTKELRREDWLLKLLVDEQYYIDVMKEAAVESS